MFGTLLVESELSDDNPLKELKL
ncbi:hypothetical protein HOE425_160008 [Hoeflea sp. EC-HK425]|nr:hypothetical protein HOE425_160008 [Hoeflea sp. EC-HK425]